MEKKVYNGLEAELISFVQNEIETWTGVPDSTGCYVGSITNFIPDTYTSQTTAAECEYYGINDFLILNWANNSGHTVW